MLNKIVISSKENPDWNGSWLRTETEAEMRELGQDPSGNDWLYWITGHVFDCRDFDEKCEQFVCDTPHDVTLRLKDGTARIRKF